MIEKEIKRQLIMEIKNKNVKMKEILKSQTIKNIIENKMKIKIK